MDRDYWDSLAATYRDDLLEIAVEDGAPVLREEVAAHGHPDHRVADLGCGPGSLLPHLVQCFGQVVAVDYARNLLEEARRRCGSRKVEFRCHDLSGSVQLELAVEVACCVNALIDPDFGKRERMAGTVAGVLQPGGAALIVAPALESLFHVFHTLLAIRKREGRPAGLGEKEAERLLREEVESFSGGIVRVGGVPTKHWMREELLAFLQERGLIPQRVRRLEFGWKEEIDDPPAWLAGRRPWDWLVVCRRE